MTSSPPRIKTALYVDFDNIYLGLREDSPVAAEQFATAPDRWLRWIEGGMASVAGDEGEQVRRAVLVRKCYLNPQTFGRFRAYFTRTGFSVVDCPPLTTRGKNSTDIVMVMDILDALRHETCFDEFVIMSGDADFTPVLQRLRMHDRRTAALVSGQVAPAYRAACDLLIPEETFLESALELRPAQRPMDVVPAAPARSEAGPELLDSIARRVYEEASANGSIPATELPQIFREFPEFTPTSSWLGFYSLRSLAEAVVARRAELQLVEGDPTWRVGVGERGEAAGTDGAGNGGRDEARRRIVARVAEIVSASPEPVGMARMAHGIIREFGDGILDSHWLGSGTFKNLLLRAEPLPFAISAAASGLLYDPERHEVPAEQAMPDTVPELPEELASFIRRVHQLTETPKLSPDQYRVLFETVAKELGRVPYSLMGTGKAVRDQCLERGVSIPRQAVTFVLRGLGYVRYPFHKVGEPHRPADLAVAFRGNVVNLLRQAQAEFSADDVSLVDRWLVEPSLQDLREEVRPEIDAAPLTELYVPLPELRIDDEDPWTRSAFPPEGRS
jgi:hypothetical protein